ncbi:MAG: hypothetical protein Q9M08_01070 [Mariprofundus sp.]|nr:hypothetical protein [Mariprofundus sp.]
MVLIWRLMQLTGLLVICGNNAWAVDSYRFLHVTIDTPWFIFIFLFFLVFSPMILSAVIHWRNALKRHDDEEEESTKEDNKHD